MPSQPQKAATKTELYSAIAEKTGLSKKDVGTVIDSLQAYIKSQLGEQGPGVVVVPGLVKIKRHLKPKQAARMGRNPMTGATIEIAAKPARVVVKVRPLKPLLLAGDLGGDIGTDP